MIKIEDFFKTSYYKVSGIYKIYNKNGFYIGSAKCLKKRINSHLGLLKAKKHPNYILIEQYPNQLFIEILETYPTYSKNEILAKENEFINNLNPPWNISLIAGAPMAGRKHTPNTIKKFKARIPWNKGIPRTLEEKQKMSQSKIIGFQARGIISKKSIKKPKKPFICNETGKIFYKQTEAAQEYNIFQGTISHILKGEMFQTKGYSFKYIILEDEKNES